MWFDLLLYGSLAGLVHFAVMGLLYGNPIIGQTYARAMASEPGVKRWPSRQRYLLVQFLGTQIEVYVITSAYLVARDLGHMTGFGGVVVVGTVIAALRLY